ncbi:MAG: hypothetical protein H6R04_428 [Burkholderiaceae bacterium]|nr:hypothetical protein [Burkholderiaceae bacterium]
MTLTTLVAGQDAQAREAAIAAAIASGGQADDTALIFEGSPAVKTEFNPAVRLIRIAPGCPCCTGRLTMQVTLNRILRQPPARLYIGLANAAHLDAFRDFLTRPPYASLLTMTEDIRLPDSPHAY